MRLISERDNLIGADTVLVTIYEYIFQYNYSRSVNDIIRNSANGTQFFLRPIDFSVSICYNNSGMLRLTG